MIRKLITPIILSLLLIPTTSMARNRVIAVKLLDNVSVSAGGYAISNPINLSHYYADGHFSGQISVSTGGTYKFEVLASGDNSVFRAVDGQSPIKTGVTTTSGPDSDGKLFVPFNIGGPASYIEIKATETGGSSGGVVSFIIEIGSDK